MKSKKIREWAAKNCPYKKFKWHTEEMCKNCTKDAEEIEALVDKDKQEMIAEVISEISEAKSDTEDMGFFAKLFGIRAAVLSCLDDLKIKIKQIGE